MSGWVGAVSFVENSRSVQRSVGNIEYKINGFGEAASFSRPPWPVSLCLIYAAAFSCMSYESTFIYLFIFSVELKRLCFLFLLICVGTPLPTLPQN